MSNPENGTRQPGKLPKTEYQIVEEVMRFYLAGGANRTEMRRIVRHLGLAFEEQNPLFDGEAFVNRVFETGVIP